MTDLVWMSFRTSVVQHCLFTNGVLHHKARAVCGFGPAQHDSRDWTLTSDDRNKPECQRCLKIISDHPVVNASAANHVRVNGASNNQ
jgi:hypothetical protein